MRANILFIGTVIFATGVALLLRVPNAGYFTTPAGAVNIFLGLVTGKSFGVTNSDGRGKAPRVLVDRAVLRTGTYQLAFFADKLILKKLASAKTTIILAILLFFVGLFFEGGGLIGGLSGGLTGYSLQEYLTQKKRNMISRLNTAGVVAPGDLEFGYDKLEKVRLRRSSMHLFVKDGVVRISLPRRYADRMRPALESILAEKYEGEPTPDSSGS